jgi:hypothetical protein
MVHAADGERRRLVNGSKHWCHVEFRGAFMYVAWVGKLWVQRIAPNLTSEPLQARPACQRLLPMASPRGRHSWMELHRFRRSNFRSMATFLARLRLPRRQAASWEASSETREVSRSARKSTPLSFRPLKLTRRWVAQVLTSFTHTVHRMKEGRRYADHKLLRNITLLATKVHVILRSSVVLTWMRDAREPV